MRENLMNKVSRVILPMVVVFSSTAACWRSDKPCYSIIQGDKHEYLITTRSSFGQKNPSPRQMDVCVRKGLGGLVQTLEKNCSSIRISPVYRTGAAGTTDGPFISPNDFPFAFAGGAFVTADCPR